MGSFGRNKSSSTQTSQSTSAQDSQQSSFGQNVSGSAQNVWGAQAPALESLFGAAQGLIGQGNAMAPKAQQAWESMLQPGVNPYFSQSLDQAISAATRGFTRDVLPALQSNATGMGVYGGVRDQLAQGQAAGDFGASLQNMVAQMSMGQYQQDRNAQMQALGMAPQLSGLQYQPLQVAGSLIGGPTVLGSSFGQGWQGSQSTSQGTSQSTGLGSSKGSGFNFGIG